MQVINKFKLWFWPILTCGWFAVTVIITYTIAVLNGHVYPIFPYISDTGAFPPESCIFGQMCNIDAAFLAITMYIRYRQVEMLSKNTALKKTWNEIAFWTGNISALGISVVANFQAYNILSVHIIGAFMTLGIGLIYMIVQVRISFALNHYYQRNPDCKIGPSTAYIRLFLTICFVISKICLYVCTFLALSEFKGDSIPLWNEDSGGYQMHVASTVSEWLMVSFLGLLILSFTKEFKLVQFGQISFTHIHTDLTDQELERLKSCTSKHINDNWIDYCTCPEHLSSLGEKTKND